MLLDEQRKTAIKNSLAEKGWDALICRLPENVLFLSGWWPLTGTSWVIYSAEAEPHLIVPACEQEEAISAGVETCSIYEWAYLDASDPEKQLQSLIGNLMAQYGLIKGTIGIEESFENIAPPLNIAEPVVPAKPTRQLLQQALPLASFVDATELITHMRVRKTPREIKLIRRANEITSFGLAAFQENARTGISEIELASAINNAVAIKGSGYKGVKSARAFAQISSGPSTARAWRPCGITTNRKLEKGDITLLELAVVADGFWADNTRLMVVGGPNAQQKKIYDLIIHAQEAAIDCIKSKVKMSTVDSVARNIITEAGYGDNFIHVTGHGIGWRYHEIPPLLHPNIHDTLEEGMVLSVEPGIYIPGFGGMRVEDIVAVGRNCADILSIGNRKLE